MGFAAFGNEAREGGALEEVVGAGEFDLPGGAEDLDLFASNEDAVVDRAAVAGGRSQ